VGERGRSWAEWFDSLGVKGDRLVLRTAPAPRRGLALEINPCGPARYHRARVETPPAVPGIRWCSARRVAFSRRSRSHAHPEASIFFGTDVRTENVGRGLGQLIKANE
jgi:hypothetical protein